MALDPRSSTLSRFKEPMLPDMIHRGWLTDRLTYANVVATLALFIALWGRLIRSNRATCQQCRSAAAAKRRSPSPCPELPAGRSERHRQEGRRNRERGLQRQLLLTTHDRRFADVLVRKLSPRDSDQTLIVHDFEGWTRNGPVIRSERPVVLPVMRLLHRKAS